jgi:hypothetical protein
MPILEHDGRTTDTTEIRNGHKIEPDEFLPAHAGLSTVQRVPSDHATPASPERIAGRVGQFLTDHRPALFCDDCITAELGLSSRRQASRVTVRLATTSNFWRDVGACSVCCKHKQVVRNV